MVDTRTIEIPPNYENTIPFMADQLINGNVDRGAERDFMHSLLESVRYLAVTDPDAMHRALKRVRDGR